MTRTLQIAFVTMFTFSGGQVRANEIERSVAAPISNGGSVNQRATRPNVVVVITDDQGYGDLACHGNPMLKTPNLDRLYGESIRFTDFHVAPMCTPTRGQLLTGLDALRNGAMNVSSGRTLLRRPVQTMADYFLATGYATGQFGKWHLGDNFPYRPQDRGFQRSLWFPSSHIPSAPDRWNNDYFDPWFREQDGGVRRFSGYCTDVIFEQAIDWIRSQAEGQKPFFAYLATNAPHGPLWVADRWREPYRDQPKNVASFLGMVANIDWNIGRLSAALGDAKLAENTILVFLTDNGGTAGVPIYNAGMRGRKIELYDGGHRVPCFVRWPAGGLRPPGDVDALTHCQDLLPTLIDLCNLKRPPDSAFDGVSLAAMLRGTDLRLADRMLVTQFSRMNAPVPRFGDAAVLWQKWRLVNNDELYDLRSDPAQSRNVATDHPDVLDRMRSHYKEWWSRVEPRVNEHSLIVVGDDAENPTVLSAADWADVFLDQSAQVRRGESKNGSWKLHVARDGTYEISLRRWPAESGLVLAAAAPPFRGKDGGYPEGKSLPITRARLMVGTHDLSKAIVGADSEATFELTLKAGPLDLRSWFFDSTGAELCGAYYAYVRRKDIAH